MTDEKIVFPKGFLWGTATAGHQIEGDNDKSDWWKFEQEGKIYDGTKSGKNVDYWNRYEEDHDIMSGFGFQGFRLGIEWSRIEPEDGRFDMEAVAHYRKILQSLRDHKIKICLTIYHWVLPLWFAEKGGWENPKAVERFLSYVKFIVNELGEFPDFWVTVNEPSSPSVAGWLMGIFPPEKKSFPLYCLVVNKFLRAHAGAYELIHRIVPHAPGGGPVMVGIAQAYQWIEPYGSPGLAGLYEKAMAPTMAWGSFGAWDKSIVTGRAQLPFGVGEKIADLKDSYDFCGVNYYTRMSLKFDPSKKDQAMLDPYFVPQGMDINQMGWQNYPPGFHKTLMKVWETFKKPIVITENGVADPGDEQRPKYTLEHIAQMSRAVKDGADVRAYFYWSYIDNFEWREGFVKKLGLIGCNYADPELKRIPKKSAFMYSDIIRENGITPEIARKYSPAAFEGVFGPKWMI
jgi:beta-glucosidase